jgi:WhiB family redox-sensing transcriptional regulator
MMRLAPLPAPVCGHEAIPGTIACPTCDAPEDWREHAVCRQTDPEVFFPSSNDPRPATQVALKTCASCPVKPYCLEEGWQDHYGIWGGWTAEARRKERRRKVKASRTEIRALSLNTRTE